MIHTIAFSRFGDEVLALTVRRQGGVVVEYGDSGVVFDPTSKAINYPAFVSHAHADHTAAFKYPNLVKHATEPTHRLIEALGWKRTGVWNPIKLGGSLKIDDIEVHVHNAGHVLGSVQFEATTPEGTVLYTGDFDLGNSYTMKAAETVSCDILVVETTFGAPMFSFPKRKEVALEMVRWAVHEVIPRGKVPTFKTDSVGNAQEIIYIFNWMTKLPVVTAKSATKASGVYREFGHQLDFVDSNSDEGEELLEEGRCVFITPKGSKPLRNNLEVAFASGWATIIKGRRGRAFPLSDHADFRGLLSFIRHCHPKRVLTIHGGTLTKGFNSYVRKRLGIDARPLTTKQETLMGPVSRGEVRERVCQDQLLGTIRIPGFEYASPWLVREMARRGFNRRETETALQRLLEIGLLVPSKSGVKLR